MMVYFYINHAIYINDIYKLHKVIYIVYMISYKILNIKYFLKII